MKRRPFYTTEEFRLILRWSRGVCHDALRQHKILSFRLGRKYFILASEVDRLSQLAIVGNNDTPKANPDPWQHVKHPR